ncbi:glycosyltransferase family 2 protein [Candidatus Woesearchaeota archaeon]|nr:glycosyltransferase family 2 protein [Candidatus Woesearchaeota archaeon]
MKDLIMLLSSVLFGIVFSFLVIIFGLFVISKFLKKQEKPFKPNISIVIPAYNEEKNIQECLDSISNSNYPLSKIKVIVVDDGSTDSTIKILKKNKNLKILRQNHLGKVEALNYGASKASNEFIVTIDADTILDKNCIRELLIPFADSSIGATTGNNNVRNKKSILGTFQNVEYHLSNVIRNSFSSVFNSGAWISGSLACYRKKALKKIRYFKKDTMAEDIDVALEMKKEGYTTITAPKAIGHTIVPVKFKDLYRQRVRWWIGTLQAIFKNRSLFSIKSPVPILFLYITHFWWTFFAFISLPIIAYQIYYWMPYNTQTLLSSTSYFFRWFSLMGPVYVLYKIPDYGISLYSIFGVLSGIMTSILTVAGLRMFNDRANTKNLFAIFFYFPYTIVLNIIILISLLKHRFWEKSFYIK